VTKRKAVTSRATRGKATGKKKRARSQSSPAKPKRKKNGAQLNAVVSPPVFKAFREHCRTRNLKRDRTLQGVIEQYLESEDGDRDKRFFVMLSDTEARRFRAFRRVRHMPDRSLLVEDALRGYIEQNLNDPVARAEFEALLAQIHALEPN
jgi:hypothetical protein